MNRILVLFDSKTGNVARMAQLVADGAGKMFFGHIAVFNQHPPKLLPGSFLFGQGFAELFWPKQALLQQDGAKRCSFPLFRHPDTPSPVINH